MKYLDELAMAEVWIVDEQLQIYSRGNGNHVVEYEQLPENAEYIVSLVFSGELTYGEDFSDTLGTNTLTVGAPIYQGLDVVGAVLVHSPVSGVTDAITQGVFTLLAGCIVALLFAGVVSVFLSYRFASPLRQMKETAFQLAEGNYQVSTGVSSSDEIGQLADAIDILAIRLKAAQAERENIDKLRENFVANVSHELRTPVAVLRGYLELLRDGTVTDAKEIQEYYEQMLSESCHMERLVNDLLELSRLQDIGFQLAMEEIDLCHVLSDAARAIRRTTLSKELTIELVLPESECLIQGDYGRIRQMLLILLDNAVKFSSEGGNH